MQRPLSARSYRLIAASILLILCLQYFIAETIAVLAWNTAPYSYTQNYISDLGVTECLSGAAAAKLSIERTLCSPLHTVMNIGFITQGILVMLTIVALWPLLSRRMRIFATPLAAIHAVGVMIVGFFPGSLAEQLGGGQFTAVMHGLGAALAILAGNLLIIAVGLIVYKKHRPYARMSLVLGLIGMCSAVALGFGQDFGLGIGAIERFAVNPIPIWLALTGCIVLLAQARHRTINL